mgnify:CR=1 FL=1
MNVRVALPDEQTKILDNIFSALEADDQSVDDSFYSIGLYRCLCLIDSLIDQNYDKSIHKIISVLEAYMNLFKDKYVFYMMQMVVFLKYGILSCFV